MPQNPTTMIPRFMVCYGQDDDPTAFTMTVMEFDAHDGYKVVLPLYSTAQKARKFIDESTEEVPMYVRQMGYDALYANLQGNFDGSEDDPNQGLSNPEWIAVDLLPIVSANPPWVRLIHVDDARQAIGKALSPMNSETVEVDAIEAPFRVVYPAGSPVYDVLAGTSGERSILNGEVGEGVKKLLDDILSFEDFVADLQSKELLFHNKCPRKQRRDFQNKLRSLVVEVQNLRSPRPRREIRPQ